MVIGRARLGTPNCYNLSDVQPYGPEFESQPANEASEAWLIPSYITDDCPSYESEDKSCESDLPLRLEVSIEGELMARRKKAFRMLDLIIQKK